MEFNAVWFHQKRSKYISRLHPTTIELIGHYGTFYGIDPDQLIDSAVSKVMAEDEAFVAYVRTIHKRNAPFETKITTSDKSERT